MSYVNPHSPYIDEKIAALRRSTRWATKIVDTGPRITSMRSTSSIITS